MIKKYQEFINESFTNLDITINTTYSESEIYSYVQSLHRNEEDFYDGNLGERIEYYSKYKVLEIPIDKINMDEYYLDDDYVNDYIQIFNEKKLYPPIVLGHFDTKWGYDIIDGNHRANALRKLGFKSIICFVGFN